MCASRRSAFWPQLVAILLIGLGAAGCSDSERFSGIFDSHSAPPGDLTGSSAQRAPASSVVSRPLAPLTGADGQGVSGGGRGVEPYRPREGEITGSVRRTVASRRWTSQGDTAIAVMPGETLDMIARKHGVSVAAIMRANNITNPARVHAGQHLVIPRQHPTVAHAPPTTRIATIAPRASDAAAVDRPRNMPAPAASVHVVAPGETLHSIARLYGKSVHALAKANNIPLDGTVKVGVRLVIPGARPLAAVEAPAPPIQSFANAQSSHSAWTTIPAAPAAQESPVKTAEPVGALPSFRWPVRGRVIAGFGPKPNGLANDGIDLAVPEGTPIKAAAGGVVAYAGNELKGYGNLVLLRHDDGYVTAYAHASEILVKRGETVKRGQVIARAGDTGSVKSPELHFEIRKGATPVDPTQFLNGA